MIHIIKELGVPLQIIRENAFIKEKFKIYFCDKFSKIEDMNFFPVFHIEHLFYLPFIY